MVRLNPEIDRVVFIPVLAWVAGVIVTARGDENDDWLSRYFAPAKGIDEGPVTGGARCALTPFWSSRLGKSELRAFQASGRGGEMICRTTGIGSHSRVLAVSGAEGNAEI